MGQNNKDGGADYETHIFQSRVLFFFPPGRREGRKSDREVLRAATGGGGIDQYEQIITGASVPVCKECDIAEAGDGGEEINGLLFVDP